MYLQALVQIHGIMITKLLKIYVFYVSSSKYVILYGNAQNVYSHVSQNIKLT